MKEEVETLDASVSTPDVRGRDVAGIARGDRIGKYTIGERLGRGGMGVVYRARDERLGRDVAIKLVYATGAGSLGRAEREAQALARLSHPNVVAVYEVGEHTGRLFVAMEYVAGGTARTWLVERTRSWRDIVAMYSAAGAGLAAAHAAGIVHRDFKPDNVLVGNDGRPRVADFGLAVAPGAKVDANAATAAPSSRLTETGAVVGTPAYMAPEQLHGADADARADQFAFCVTVWEALYGVRPFDGKTWEALEAALREPPRASDAHVPRHVAAALRRGLSHDPTARWPSVDALVAALGRDRRRQRLAITGAVGMLAIGAVAVSIVRHNSDPCAATAGELAPIWNPARAVAMQASFVAAGGGDAWPAISRALDRYADEWSDAERATCRATRDRAQPADKLDTRGACMYRARTRLGAVADSLVHADRAGVASAADQLRLLPLVADCGDGAFALALPGDPRQRFRFVVLDTAWHAVEAELYAYVAQPRSELDALDAASHGLEQTSLRPLAAAIHGQFELDAGDPTQARADFDTAIQASIELGDEHRAAVLMKDMADSYLLGGQQVAARHWTKLAAGLAHHLGDPPDLGSAIAGLEARDLEQGPQHREAAKLRRRQVELSRKASHNPIDAIIDQESLAFAASDDDDPVAMDREVRVGIGLIERDLGTEHPMMIRFESFRTAAAMRAGKLDDAERTARHAIALAERWYGPESPDSVTALQNLGAILQRRGDIAGMMTATQRALVAARKRDPDGADVGHLEGNLGIAYAETGDLASAAPHLERAAEIIEHLYGPDFEPLDDLYVARAYIARGLGQLEDSRQLLVRAVAIADKVDLGRVNPRIELSYTLVAMHRGPEAVAELESVAELVSSPSTEPRIAAEYHLALAKALDETGARARAIAQATTSRDAWTALGADFVPQRDEAAAWLRAHR